MFKVCGKSAKYEEGNMDEENQLIEDLLAQEKQNDANVFGIKTKHKEFYQLLVNMLEPGLLAGQSDGSGTMVIQSEEQQQTQVAIPAQPVEVGQAWQRPEDDLDLEEASETTETTKIIEQEHESETEGLSGEVQQQPEQIEQTEENGEQAASGLFFPKISLNEEAQHQTPQPDPAEAATTHDLNLGYQPVVESPVSQVKETVEAQESIVPMQISINSPNYDQFPAGRMPIEDSQIAAKIVQEPEPVREFTQEQLDNSRMTRPDVVEETENSELLASPATMACPQVYAREQYPSEIEAPLSVSYAGPQECSPQQDTHSAELELLRMELAEEQTMFEQQMELIQMQQEKLLEHEKKEEDTQHALEELRDEIELENNLISSSMNSSREEIQDDSVRGNYETPNYRASAHNNTVDRTPLEYENAKLSLTSTSLCGFDGQEKLFEINLGQPNVVEFEPGNLRIVVEHKDGPIIIRAESRMDYDKWSRSIQKCVDNAREGVTSRGLVMKLDKSTMQLYVYKGDTEQPSKIFNVANCQAEIRVEDNYGSVKVRCVDGRKFSFGDKLAICQQWAVKLRECGGSVEYL